MVRHGAVGEVKAFHELDCRSLSRHDECWDI